MKVQVRFYSYFKDLAGGTETVEELPAGSTVGDLYALIARRFPKLEAMGKSTLIAVGLDYQGRDHVLQEGDEVSLFPPVQGG